MKEPRPGAWHRGLWMESSAVGGVPAVFETCETLVLLDGCPACANLSQKESLKWDGNTMKVGRGRAF